MKKNSDVPVTIHLFGDLHISVNTQPLLPLPAKVQRLLALLVLQGQERPLSRTYLAETIWPGSPVGLQMLRSAVFTLRKELGKAHSVLPAENRKTLRLDLPRTSVDVLLFDRAVALGEDAQAVGLYRGELLKGWTEEWAVQERQKREKQYRAALERLDPDESNAAAPAAPGKNGAAAGGNGVSSFAEGSEMLSSPFGVRDMARLRTLVNESRTHLARAVTALEQLERRVALLEAQGSRPAGKRRASGSSEERQETDLNVGTSYYQLGLDAFVQGRDQEAEDYLHQALDIFTTPPGHPEGEADVYHKLSGMAIRKGDYDLARDYAQRCRVLRVQMNNPKGTVSALLHLGDVGASTDEAIRYYKEAEEIARREKDDLGAAWANLCVAQAPLFRDPENWTQSLLPDAARRFRSALMTFLKHDYSTGIFLCLDGIARLLWAAGRRSEAVWLLRVCNELRGEDKYAIARTERAEKWLSPLLREGRSLPQQKSDDSDRELQPPVMECTLEQAARFAMERLHRLSLEAAKLAR